MQGPLCRAFALMASLLLHTKTQRLLILCAGLFATASLLAAAADPSGLVTGRITNVATGDVLSNVVVDLAGTDARATTDLDGNFRIAVPPGPARLVISYPGLDRQEISVSISAGQTVVRDIGLTSEIYRMDKFVVKSLREGQAAAIQEERESANARTVAAIDAYGNPGAAVGELMGLRLP